MRQRFAPAALVLSVVRRRVIPTAVSLACAGVVALLFYGVSKQSVNRTLDELVARGQYPPAPETTVSLPVLGGSERSSLASLTRGRVVVLNFWASWCVPCQEEAPLLERAQRELQGHGGTVLGVTFQDASPDSESFARQYHLTYPSLRDTTGDFAHSYGTQQVPESFIINRRGQIVGITRGEIEQRFLDRAIALAQGT